MLPRHMQSLRARTWLSPLVIVKSVVADLLLLVVVAAFLGVFDIVHLARDLAVPLGELVLCLSWSLSLTMHFDRLPRVNLLIGHCAGNCAGATVQW
jgi:hypothetical protein